MDLRLYYDKLRQAEQSIATPFAVVISEDTPDGGRAGVANEVRREIAAQLLVSGRARLATKDEAEEYRASAERARLVAEERRLASRVQVMVVQDTEGRPAKLPSKMTKG